MLKRAGNLCFLLLQLLLPLFHRPFLLGNRDHMHVEVLLLLDSGINAGLDVDI
jgi:hypothetical protein